MTRIHALTIGLLIVAMALSPCAWGYTRTPAADSTTSSGDPPELDGNTGKVWHQHLPCGTVKLPGMASPDVDCADDAKTVVPADICGTSPGDVLCTDGAGRIPATNAHDSVIICTGNIVCAQRTGTGTNTGTATVTALHTTASGTASGTSIATGQVVVGAGLQATKRTGTGTSTATATVTAFDSSDTVTVVNTSTATSTHTHTVTDVCTNAAGGCPILDGAGKIPTTQLPTNALNSKTFSVANPVVVGNSVTFATIANADFSAPLRIEYNTHDPNFAQSKVYDVAMYYNATGGLWYVLRPTVKGLYNAEDMAIDAYVLNGVSYLRLRRVAGTTAGTAYITVTSGGDAANTGVAASVDLCTVAAPCTDVPTFPFPGSNVEAGTTSILPKRLADGSYGDSHISDDGAKITFLGGQDWYPQGSGMTFSMGWNANGNKQLWIGDPDYYGVFERSFIRLLAIGDQIGFDAVSGDGTRRRPLYFGDPGDDASTLHLMNLTIDGSSNLFTTGRGTFSKIVLSGSTSGYAAWKAAAVAGAVELTMPTSLPAVGYLKVATDGTTSIANPTPADVGAIPDSATLTTEPPLKMASSGTITEERTNTSTGTATITNTNSSTNTGTGTGTAYNTGTVTDIYGPQVSMTCTKATTSAGIGTCTGATASVTATKVATITVTGSVTGSTTGTVTAAGTGSAVVTAGGSAQTVNLLGTASATWTYTLWSANLSNSTYTGVYVQTASLTGTLSSTSTSTSTATSTSTSTSTSTATVTGTSTNKSTGKVSDNLTVSGGSNGVGTGNGTYLPRWGTGTGTGSSTTQSNSTVKDDGTGPVAPNLGLTDGTPGKTLLKPGLTATALLLQSGYAVTIAPNGNVYLIGNSKIYMQVAGVGNFVDLNQTSRSWQGIRAMSNGDVVAVVFGGGVYRQTGGTGDFVSTGDANRSWQAVGEDTAGNEWFVADDIYVRAGHTGALTALGTGSNAWSVIDGAKDGSVIAGRWAGQLYRKAVGGTTFDLIAGSPTAQWNVAHGASNGDFYVTTTEAGLGPYLLTSGGSSWVNLAIPAGATNGNALTSVAVDAAGRVLAVGSRYYQLVAAAVEMRMPSTNGTPGQVLGTDGSGQWIWTTVNTSTSTSSATNTYTQAGLKKVNVQNGLVYGGSTTLDVSEVTNALARPSGTCPSGYALTSTTPGQTACVAVSGSVGLYPNGVNCSGKTKFYSTDGQLTWCGDATAADVNAIPATPIVAPNYTPSLVTYNTYGQVTGSVYATPAGIGAVATADFYTGVQAGPATDQSTAGSTSPFTVVTVNVAVPSGSHAITANGFAVVESQASTNRCYAALYIDGSTGAISEQYFSGNYNMTTMAVGYRKVVAGGGNFTVRIQLWSASGSSPCVTYAGKAQFTYMVSPN